MKIAMLFGLASFRLVLLTGCRNLEVGVNTGFTVLSKFPRVIANGIIAYLILC
jgi:hypothetical protein